MKVRCRTNLDNYKHEKWPEEFCCRPMIGDAVQSKNKQRLYIVTITHTMYDVNEFALLVRPNIQPMLIIELHKYEAVPKR